VVDLIFEMQAHKAEGKELYQFEVGYFRDDYEKNKVVKSNYRKRQLYPRVSKQGKLEADQSAVNHSLEIPKNILPDLTFTETEIPKNHVINVNISNYNYPQEQHVLPIA
jgi:hypothetical protein